MPTAYPSVPLSVTSKLALEDGRFLNAAPGGHIDGGTYFTAPVYKLEIKHQDITSAQTATLESFFDSNLATADIEVTFTDGVTYTGQMLGLLSYPTVAELFYVSVTFQGVPV